MNKFSKTPIEELIEYAESGNAEAQVELGARYYNGVDGVSVDKVKAIDYYEQAYYFGENMEAAWRLGKAYVDGDGVEQDTYQGINLLEEAASKGIARAEALLGLAYINEGDVDEALKWTKKAAHHHDIIGETLLGGLYYNGVGVKEDWATAFKWKKIAATTHDHEYDEKVSFAQYHLGLAYEAGEGVRASQSEAIKWYMKSAEGGTAEAQREIGERYLHGTGLPKDITKAVYWLEKAAAQDDEIAQSYLAVVYGYSDKAGNGAYDIDTGLSVDYMIKAAENGNRIMMGQLGARMISGIGVAKDIQRGVHWLTKAADAGDTSSMYNLGYLYYYGEDVAKNYEQAAYWLNKCASNKGNPKAKSLLGLMYWNGNYFKKDTEKAIELLTEAKNEGCNLAKDFFDRIEVNGAKKGDSKPAPSSKKPSIKNTKPPKGLKAIVAIAVIVALVCVAFNPVKDLLESKMGITDINSIFSYFENNEETTVPEKPHYIMNTDYESINIRSGAGSKNKVIAQVDSTSVKMYPTGNEKNGWYEVESDEFGTAWVHNSVVEYVEP